MTPQQTLDTALRLHDAGKLREAEALYHQLLTHNPNQPAVLQRLAHLAHQVKDYATAEYVLRHALRLVPNSADNQFNLALVLNAQARTEEAIAACRATLAIRPNDPTALCSLGQMLYTLGHYQESINACRRAIELRPNYPEAFNNLGISLVAIGEPLQAIEAYRQALALQPTFALAYNNLSVALEAFDRYEEILLACQQAVALDPNYADAQNNLGRALQNLARNDEAIAAFRKSIELDPSRSTLHSNYLLCLNYHPATDARLIFDESCRSAQTIADPLKKFITPHTNNRSPDRPLRIGYVSPDLHHHSVAFFLLPLLEAHDRSAFQIICYPVAAHSDAVSDRLRACSELVRPLMGLTGEEAVRQIRDDHIDILVDLAGHTAQTRLLFFARRPAPVQVAWLGYPATTGLDTIDYRITDSLADPPTDDPALHSEKLLRLPQTAWCFTPLSGSPPIDPPPHLTNHYITFGTLNFFPKLNNETFRLWSKLLHRVPDSHLLLKVPNAPQTTNNLLQIFASHGITSDRLILVHRESANLNHLQRYNRLDIALDTFPYNGTTTTCEALWMGVPVITLTGDRHVSRVGQSLLTNIGLSDLVAHTPDQFLDIAQKLAADSACLLTLRATLRTRMQNSPLMDAPAFARHMEAAYRQIWQKWCAAKDD